MVRGMSEAAAETTEPLPNGAVMGEYVIRCRAHGHALRALSLDTHEWDVQEVACNSDCPDWVAPRTPDQQQLDRVERAVSEVAKRTVSDDWQAVKRRSFLKGLVAAVAMPLAITRFGVKTEVDPVIQALAKGEIDTFTSFSFVRSADDPTTAWLSEFVKYQAKKIDDEIMAAAYTKSFAEAAGRL